MAGERRFLYDPKQGVWIDREKGEPLSSQVPLLCRTCGRIVFLEEARPPYPDIEYYCSWECYSSRE